MTAIDRHLGNILAAHWRGGNRTVTTKALREALAADDALRTEAAARKAELEALDQKCNGQLHRRCAVSAIHLRALRGAID